MTDTTNLTTDTTNLTTDTKTVPLEEYNRAVTAMFYLFNLSIDFAKALEVNVERSGVLIETDIGTFPMTSILNVFINVDKIVEEATLSEGFSIVPLTPYVTVPENNEPEDSGLIVPPLHIVQ